MSRRELDAAGITEPRLRAAYSRCRELNAQHGRTYFLATRLLAPRQRPAVHALYGFARYVDNLVDEPDVGTPPERIRQRIDEAGRLLAEGLAGDDVTQPAVAAVVDTARRFAIDHELFDAFLHSMRMDLTVDGYPTRDDLVTYVHGSARVIGLQMLPVLGTVTTTAEAAPAAAALGEAFQLTNFIRDVAEDLDRGRVYLPADELAAFDVDRERLAWCRSRRRADPAVRRAIADQIATTRAIYRKALPGIAMLRPESRACIATALTLYARILDRVEAIDHDVFAARAAVSIPGKVRVAGPALVRAWWARTPQRPTLVHSGPKRDITKR